MPLTPSIAQMNVPGAEGMVWLEGPVNPTLAVRSGAPTGVSLFASTNEKRNRFDPTASSDEMGTGRTDGFGPLDWDGADNDPVAAQPAMRTTAHRAIRGRIRDMTGRVAPSAADRRMPTKRCAAAAASRP